MVPRATTTPARGSVRTTRPLPTLLDAWKVRVPGTSPASSRAEMASGSDWRVTSGTATVGLRVATVTRTPSPSVMSLPGAGCCASTMPGVACWVDRKVVTRLRPVRSARLVASPRVRPMKLGVATWPGVGFGVGVGRGVGRGVGEGPGLGGGVWKAETRPSAAISIAPG